MTVTNKHPESWTHRIDLVYDIARACCPTKAEDPCKYCYDEVAGQLIHFDPAVLTPDIVDELKAKVRLGNGLPILDIAMWLRMKLELKKLEGGHHG